MTLRLFLLLLIVLPSCRNATSPASGTIEIRPVNSEVMLPDLFLGRPYRLLVAGDNLLIADLHDGEMLSIVDLTSKKPPRRLLRQGKGPHEFMFLRHFFIDAERRLVLADQMTRDLHYYRLSGDDIEINPQTWDHTVQMADLMVREMAPLGDLILTNGAYEDGEFRLYGPQGESLLSFGKYPGQSGMNLSSEGQFLMNQTFLAACPDGKRFAAAGVYHDQLVFYEMQDDKPVLRKEYFSKEPKLNVSESGQGKGLVSSIRESSETICHYTAVYPTQNYLYVVYTGAHAKPEQEGQRPEAVVYKYTWEGEPVCGYKMPIQPKCIAVDEHDRTLYAIVIPSDESSQLIRFSLD